MNKMNKIKMRIISFEFSVPSDISAAIKSDRQSATRLPFQHPSIDNRRPQHLTYKILSFSVLHCRKRHDESVLEWSFGGWNPPAGKQVEEALDRRKTGMVNEKR